MGVNYCEIDYQQRHGIRSEWERQYWQHLALGASLLELDCSTGLALAAVGLVAVKELIGKSCRSTAGRTIVEQRLPAQGHARGRRWVAWRSMAAAIAAVPES